MIKRRLAGLLVALSVGLGAATAAMAQDTSAQQSPTAQQTDEEQQKAKEKEKEANHGPA